MATLRKAILAGSVVAMAAGWAATAAFAADEPANLIKYRQAVMKAIGGHMGAIAGIAKGEVSFIDEVEGHALAINTMSGSLLRLFPKGSGTEAGDTRALPEIWQQWSDFEEAVESLKSESAKLAEVARGGDMGAIGAQVGALGKNGCGGCHKKFRKEKE
jgi:cytochrome c556